MIRASLSPHVLIAALALLSACTSPEVRLPAAQPDQGAAQEDMMRADMAPADLGADQGAAPFEAASTWRVQVADDAPEAVQLTARDLVAYLQKMGRTATLEPLSEGGCGAGEGIVRLHEPGEGDEALWRQIEAPTDQSWLIDEQRCEQGGMLVTLAGGGLLGRQYAAYEWLHRLGVRFFHPEEEFVPQAPRFDDAPRHEEHTPDFTWRSVSLHLTHPLELGDIFREGDLTYADEAKRYIDWCIKNGASYGSSGYGSGDGKDYGLMRGLPRSTGFDLHNQQQGGMAVIDPDDPRSDEEQIKAAIDARMQADPELGPPKFFTFTFNPSEFSEIDDRVLVRQITTVTDHITQTYPGTQVYTINHGTAGEPTEHYGVRFYDLSRFAPPELGVEVHTLMFYDLFRPAPVYGNENFNFQYDFMALEHTTRNLWHYPESAWWLTFDIALPLYLPINLQARDVDIQNIAWMLDGKLNGHRVFGSGHEWGYWQNEYCSFRMSADIRYRYTDCLDDITLPMGEVAAPVVVRAMHDAIAAQERDLIYDAELLRYLVGTDPETEIAASVGVIFHPLPPAPLEIMSWDAAQFDRWERRTAPSLERHARDFDDLVARLTAVRAEVPEAGLPWFDEILDGFEANALRARHALEIYGAAVKLSQGRQRFQPKLVEDGEALLARARETTERARSVVARREEGYRYLPIERSIAGGPDGDQDQNWTVYGYRYLNRTHHVYYYHRIDELVAELFEGDTAQVVVEDTLLSGEEALTIVSVPPDIDAIQIDYGDGETAQDPTKTHTYAASGVYTLRLSGTRDGAAWSFEVPIAVLPSPEVNLGFSGKVEEPDGVAIIEPVLPAMVYGALDEQSVIVGFSAEADGDVQPGLWRRIDRLSAGADEALPTDYVVPIVNRSTATISTSVPIKNATFRWTDSRAELDGELSTSGIIAAIVAVGGFEEVGARRLVASTLGYTVDTLPELVPFLFVGTLEAEMP